MIPTASDSRMSLYVSNIPCQEPAGRLEEEGGAQKLEAGEQGGDREEGAPSAVCVCKPPRWGGHESQSFSLNHLVAGVGEGV